MASRIEDGCDLTEAAVEKLLALKKGGKRGKVKVHTLSNFLASAQTQKLSRREKEAIVDQSILVIEQFYAHLPFKRSRYAIDPVQRLRLLRAQLGQPGTELAFHTEVLETFAELRDAHTFYELPTPYRGAVAFLPFFLESIIERAGGEDRRRFVVTSVLPGFDHPFFKPGVEITYWNGMRATRAVERLAETIPGGNPAAKFIRAMMRMTVRSLSFSLPPDEEKVFVQYRSITDQDAGEERIIAIPWSVGTGIAPAIFQARGGAAVCEPLADLAVVRRFLWSHSMPAAQLGSAPPEPVIRSRLPKIFEFQHSLNPLNQSKHSSKRFGRIRIRTFGGDPDEIFDEFKRILLLMKRFAPDGLIIDVRSNPGGTITGAERLLQLLTPKDITPESFQFANTLTVQEIMAKMKALRRFNSRAFDKILDAFVEFEPWLLKDDREALASGSLLTEGHPLTAVESANDTGQVYYGPVVLVIDAGSYSATDIFSAGFQDHGIGRVIGVDENTGGGGASRWLHRDELVERLKNIPNLGIPLRELPLDAAMGLAIQRSTRVGPRAGQPLEDLGVKRDVEYILTRRDLLCGNLDLIQFACGILAKQQAFRLEILRKRLTKDGVKVTVETKNLERMVCCLNGHPQLVLNASERTFTVPLDGFGHESPAELAIKGYAWRSVNDPETGRKKKSFELVAAAKAPLG